MSNAQPYSSDVAFTPAVKSIQARKGSRGAYARVEQNGGWRTDIDENLTAFLADANSLYFATASADGQPYIQHRGGPRGFVKILDSRFPLPQLSPDYGGSQQCITKAISPAESKAHLFLMGLCASPPGQDLGRSPRDRGRPGLAGIADAAGLQGAAGTGDPVHGIAAWDTNCPQRIHGNSTPPTSPRPWPHHATRGSPNWRRRC